MLTTIILLALSVPQVDIFQSPPNTHANTDYVWNCTELGGTRRLFHGAGLHTVYVGAWNQTYTIPYDDWTLRVTGAEAYSEVRVMPEPCTIALMGLGIILTRRWNAQNSNNQSKGRKANHPPQEG